VADEPVHRILSSRTEFHDALRAAFQQAHVVGCREIFVSDTDFADWPLGERAVVDTLTQWAHAQRRFTVLARHYDEVIKRHPRWVAWRRQWAHVVECREFGDAHAADPPSLLFAPGAAVVRLLDAQNYRAVVSANSADEVRVRETLDACLQQSVSAFPATTLGL
jgi:hypothetical protein